MTSRERTCIVHRNLYGYTEYMTAIEEYNDRALGKSSIFNESGVRGTDISDPTGRGGTALAQLPAELERKRRWCEAIDEAIEELRLDDAGKEHGLSDMLIDYFCIGKKRRRKSKNAAVIEQICADHSISRSTFFKRLSKITDTVLYYATKRKLI